MKVLYAVVQLPCGKYALLDQGGVIRRSRSSSEVAQAAQRFISNLPEGPKVVEGEVVSVD